MRGADQCSYAQGGDSLRLYCRRRGASTDSALLFIHGWSCTQDVWSNQFNSPLFDNLALAAFDLRGHGYSERPIGDLHYTNSELFADDVAAAIDHLDLSGPILVGWSSGSLIVADYLRKYGANGVAGIVMVDGLYGLGIDFPEGMFGTGPARYMPDTMTGDFDKQFVAMRQCIRDMLVSVEESTLDFMVAQSMLTPPSVRASMMARVCDNRDVLERFNKPSLVIHGSQDPFIQLPMAEALRNLLPNSTLRVYENAAHMPFWEQPETFNAELAAFSRLTFDS